MAEGGGRGAGKRRTGIQNQKQEPHTKMWAKINSFDEFTILVVCGDSMVFSNKGNHGGSLVCVLSNIMWKSVTILICAELR